MSARIALVLAALLVVSGAALSQPQPKPPVAPPSPDKLIPPPGVPLPSSPAWKPEPVTPVVPREKFVDELLVELEELQAHKARLEKQEADLKAAIRKKLEAQTERLKKLGVAAEPDKVGRVIVEGNDRGGGNRVILKPEEPDRVGRVIIEGNTKTPDEKIHKLVELRPGQILPYPQLEAARQRLEKAGFRGATVEVVPLEFDSQFKDIRVKVTETDKR